MECLVPEEQLLKYAREGDLQQIRSLLQAKSHQELDLNINCRGDFANFGHNYTDFKLSLLS